MSSIGATRGSLFSIKFFRQGVQKEVLRFTCALYSIISMTSKRKTESHGRRISGQRTRKLFPECRSSAERADGAPTQREPKRMVNDNSSSVP